MASSVPLAAALDVLFQSGGDGGTLLLGVGLAFLLLFVGLPALVVALQVAGLWGVFRKADQPGWAAAVPIYNVYVLVVEVAGRDRKWVVLSLLFPILLVVPCIDVAKAFGRGVGYGIALFLLAPLLFVHLGFGTAQYRGPPVRPSEGGGYY